MYAFFYYISNIFMKSHRWHHILFVGCLFLCACHNKKNEITVTRNFEDEVQQQQNLVFNFNRDIYPDSLTQRWDSTAFIEFTPKVAGSFKWNSSSELSFSPNTGFEPGMEYKAVLTKYVLKHAKKKYYLDKHEFTFHTAPLRILNSHLSWTRGKSMANIMVQLDLDLNYDVDINTALTKLNLSSGGNNITTTGISSGTGKTISLQFAPLNDKDEETPLKIEMKKGIPLNGTPYSSTTDTIITTAIPSRFNLEVTSVSAEHSGTEGTIIVNTSQPLQEESLKQMVSLEPAVQFDISATDAGFIITSNKLVAEQSYELNISQHLEGLFGGKMKKDYSEQITFGKLEPAITFLNQSGMYLSSQGYKNLALSIVNVPKLEVTVIKVYENNIEQFIQKDKRGHYSYGDDDDDDSHWFESYNTEDLGDTIFHKEYETSKLPKMASAKLLHLDFEDKIKGYNGVYVVVVSSKDHKWVTDSKILSLSDIGLIVKQEKDNMYVFANSIKTANPLSGVKVTFVSTNNQQIYTATTGSDGAAIFNNISKTAPGFRVGLVSAKMGDEFSFVWLSKSKIETSRFDVGGREPNAVGLNAMIYAERNLYRPGETVHVSTIIRDENWNTPGEVPVKLKLTMPNGKEFATMRKILDEEGSCETSFSIPHTAITGTYVLEVYTGNDVLLNSYNISIEEFMPDRMKVELKIDKQEYNLSDSIYATIQADNLFGTPAAGRNYECEMSISKATFEAKNYSDYDFSIRNDFNFSDQRDAGETDEKGNVKTTFSLSQNMAAVGMLKGNISATVFDETGRPVHRYEHFNVYTQPVFIGMKQSEEYISTRRPQKVSLIAVDKTGKPQNATADVVVIKKEWHTVIQQDGGHYKYVSQKDEKIVKQQALAISGTNTSFYYTAEKSGEYEVRISLKGSNSYISQNFYAWGWGDTQYTSFEVNNEGNVTIKPDKDKYNMGDNVNVLLTAPFEGRMLVTIERDKIIKYYFLETKNKTASLNFKADDICVPNVYVTATLFRPMDGSDMPLTVAHGFQSISVENKRNHIPLTVTMTAKSRSKTKQTITVKTTPGAFVTVAAVDEGILQVKNYKTPNPYEYFYQKVALSTSSYDIYPLLLPEIKTTRSSTGGDGADESSLRVNPMFVNRVRLVSFWSGIQQADSRGILKYDIDIPQFSGDIRVMAIAYKDRGFSGTDQHMKVADPVVISTALPRFLSPKDEVIMPVMLSNTTNKSATANISVQVSGPIDIAGQSTQSITIPANKEQRVVFNIGAQSSIGAGKITVSVRAMNETFSNETEIAVRPPASLQKVFSSGFAADGSTTINADNNFIPSTLRGKLIISRSPLVQFSKNMTDLVRYPYGCVEQTTSTAFPQLYYADLVKSITWQEDKDVNPGYNVQQAILKLQSMQMSSGALSYWPEGGYESWWGSIFATHFLLEARKAGYEVNAHTIDRLLGYMKARLNKKETEVYYYNENLKKEIAPREVAYSLYVLALAGQSQPSSMNYYKGHPDMLSLDSKYLLAAAYSLSGQPMQAKAILPAAFSGERSNRSLGGSFYSYIRDEAISLNVLLDMDPNNQQVGIMAKHLSEQIKNEPYLSTQENVFSILAFGKIARQSNQSTATASVVANGKNIASTPGKNITIDLQQYGKSPVQLQVKGKGGYYYFREVSGITADGSYKQEDKFMKVRRNYYDRDGKEISSNTFRQNDLVIVKITLESQYSTGVPNVAVTDILPAGFEIENTRLTEMPDITWIKDQTEPDYMDIRDDRLNFFASAEAKPKHFYYMVRAVSPGNYQLGPVQADAMYNSSYHSYNGAGVVKVLSK